MNGNANQIITGVFYIHKMDHRDGSYDKSQWIIDELSERNCFSNGYQYRWFSTNHTTCWGIHIVNGRAAYLGKTSLMTRKIERKSRNLFIAKFIDSNINSNWHGYPADPARKTRGDIPPGHIVQLWANAQYIRPALVHKIVSGQLCKL